MIEDVHQTTVGAYERSKEEQQRDVDFLRNVIGSYEKLDNFTTYDGLVYDLANEAISEHDISSFETDVYALEDQEEFDEESFVQKVPQILKDAGIIGIQSHNGIPISKESLLYFYEHRLKFLTKMIEGGYDKRKEQLISESNVK